MKCFFNIILSRVLLIFFCFSAQGTPVKISATIEVSFFKENQWTVNYQLSHPIKKIRFPHFNPILSIKTYQTEHVLTKTLSSTKNTVISSKTFNYLSVGITQNANFIGHEYTPLINYRDNTSIFLSTIFAAEVFHRGKWVKIHLQQTKTSQLIQNQHKEKNFKKNYVVSFASQDETTAYKVISQAFFNGELTLKKLKAQSKILNQAIILDNTKNILIIADNSYPKKFLVLLEKHINKTQLALSNTLAPLQKTLLYLTHQTSEQQEIQIKASALPHQIMINLHANSQNLQSNKLPNKLLQVIAHEMIHVWQYQNWFNGIQTQHPWLYEGSAETLANHILFESQQISAQKFYDFWYKNRERCLIQWEERDFNISKIDFLNKTAYTCGSYFFYLTGLLIEPRKRHQANTYIWKELSKKSFHLQKIIDVSFLLDYFKKSSMKQSSSKKLENILYLKHHHLRSLLSSLEKNLPI